MPDESVDFMKDATGVFEPSDEWKKVEPGQFCWLTDKLLDFSLH